MHLTPSAVSKSISQLEEQMGVLLVKRTTRSVVLTERGQEFYLRVSGIVNDLKEAIGEVQNFKSQPKGTLRLTCSIAFGCSQLTQVVNSYMEKNPLVDIHISLNDQIINLNEENFDIALRITSTTNWNFAARNLAPIRWVYCASPGYLANNYCLEKPEDLYMHRCLVYPIMTQNGAWTFADSDGIQQEIKVNGRLVCNSSLALRAAAVDGQGVVCLPTYIASQALLSGELKRVLSNHNAVQTHTLYAMYYHSRYQNPIIRSFIDHLVRSWSPEPPWDKVLEQADG